MAGKHNDHSDSQISETSQMTPEGGVDGIPGTEEGTPAAADTQHSPHAGPRDYGNAPTDTPTPAQRSDNGERDDIIKQQPPMRDEDRERGLDDERVADAERRIDNLRDDEEERRLLGNKGADDVNRRVEHSLHGDGERLRDDQRGGETDRAGGPAVRDADGNEIPMGTHHMK